MVQCHLTRLIRALDLNPSGFQMVHAAFLKWMSDHRNLNLGDDELMDKVVAVWTSETVSYKSFLAMKLQGLYRNISEDSELNISMFTVGFRICSSTKIELYLLSFAKYN